MADVSGKFFSAVKVRTGVSPSSPGTLEGETLQPVNPPGGGLNSVGITMPSAFAVANSPLTSNGTIQITGAGTIAQYVRGDGTLETFPSLTGFVPYTGATQNVDLGEFGVDAGFVQLDTTPTNTPTSQGTIFWDVDDETVDVVLNGYIMKIGEDQFYPVKNQTGSSIAKGTAVRFAGTVGASGRLLIAPFIADGSVSSSFFMGVTAEAIADGEDGKVLYFGRIRGINTNAFNEGDVLYASTTVAGGFQTAVPLAPNNIVQVAAVINKSINQGVIFIRPSFGSNINQDEGVKIVSPTTGQLLQLQANGLWENKTTAQVLGGTSSQFVKGDGTLDSTSYQPLLTNPVTGTGSAGQVAYWSSGSEITGESNLFWDVTNDRLGIGTATPSTQLNVGHQNHGIGLAYLDSSSFPPIAGIFTSDGTAGGQTGFGSLLIKARTDFAPFYSINFFTASSANVIEERMRITAAGRVLIGSTIPAESTFALDVNGTGRFSDLTVNGNIELTTGANRLLRIGSSSAYYYDLQTVGDDFQIREAGTTPRLTFSYPTGNATFSSSVTASSIIKSGGTSSQYLMADGSVSTLTNPLTGTGTTGQVAYFTGTTTISSESNLFWDATNDRLGINVNNPVTSIHIIKSLGNDVFSIGESSINQRFIIGQQTDFAGNYINSTNIDLKLQSYLDGGTGGNIIFQTGVGSVATRVTITNTGATIFTSSVTALNFIKTGGTSSEFLKADGSVDSTTYVSSVTASSPLFSSGGATPNITIQQASGSQNGFLSSTDWTTFNNKANAGDYVTLDTTQTITGQKTFSLDIFVNGVNVGKGGGSITTNTRIGASALGSNTTGSSNTAIGFGSLQTNTTGTNNTALGLYSLLANTTGETNTAVGVGAMIANTTGNGNSAYGLSSLALNTTGNNNTGIGKDALVSNTTGGDNTSVGLRSLYNNTTGSNNTAIGFEAGQSINGGGANSTSSNSVYIGQDTRVSASGNTNEIVIGSGGRGQGSNSAVIGNDSITKTVLRGNVLIGTESDSGAKLQVTGKTSFSDNIRFSNTYAQSGRITLGTGSSFTINLHTLFTEIPISGNFRYGNITFYYFDSGKATTETYNFAATNSGAVAISRINRTSAGTAIIGIATLTSTNSTLVINLTTSISALVCYKSELTVV